MERANYLPNHVAFILEQCFRCTLSFRYSLREIQGKSVRNLNMIMKIVVQVYILSPPVCVFLFLCTFMRCGSDLLGFFNVVICKWCFSSFEIGSLLLLLLLTCLQVLRFQYVCMNISLFFVESRDFLWIQAFIAIIPWRSFSILKLAIKNSIYTVHKHSKVTTTIHCLSISTAFNVSCKNILKIYANAHADTYVYQ